MTTWIRRFPFIAMLAPRDFSSRAAAKPEPHPMEPAEPLTSPNTRLTAPEPGLEQRRGEAMRRLFPKLYGWLSNGGQRYMATEVHAYLAAATSLQDLETRIRAIERRRHFGA